MCQSYQSAKRQVAETVRRESVLSLTRIHAFAERLGNPQKRLRFIHVAGTNGKGSACAMLSAILTAAGYRTGLFTSPYLSEIREQFQIDGQLMTEEAFAALVSELSPVLSTMEERPTEFEYYVGMAFYYFMRQDCDFVVLETGMGGLTDATNIIDVPEAAVLMTIGLEHRQFLGDTLAEIARVKAGIIKPQGAVVLYPSEPEALAVLTETCARMQASCRIADFSKLKILSCKLRGQSFSYGSYQKLCLSLLAPYQCKNAAVVLETVALLQEKGYEIPEEAVREGLRTVKWRARFEVLQEKPIVLLDGAHNPQCMQAFTDGFSAHFPEKKAILITAVMRDKAYAEMYRLLAPLARAFILLPLAHPRALPVTQLAAELAQYGLPVLAAGGKQMSAAGEPPEVAAEELPTAAAGVVRESAAEELPTAAAGVVRESTAGKAPTVACGAAREPTSGEAKTAACEAVSQAASPAFFGSAALSEQDIIAAETALQTAFTCCAAEPNTVIVAVGTLYMMGALREAYERYKQGSMELEGDN